MSACTKIPADSFLEKRFPFGSDSELRDSFINSFGDLRFGKLLEEMDMAAGWISYKHTDGFDLDLTIVTAACDRIDLVSPLRSDCDLRLRGQVNFVGRSSMEVGLRLDSLVDGQWLLVARAYFIMVALKDHQGYPVHGLQTTNEEEARRLMEGEMRQQKRRKEQSRHFSRSAPTQKESEMLHALFLRKDLAQPDGVHMQETWRQATIIVHPQNRNIHNKIFGGHIMRMSFETAYTVAHLYCHRRPLFVCVDHFDFIKPVEIGSIVSFNGLVTYTGRTSFIVEVTVEVIHPFSGRIETTNVSYYTFVSVDEDCKPMPVVKVLPHTYMEGLKHLDGYKRYQNGKQELDRRNSTQ